MQTKRAIQQSQCGQFGFSERIITGVLHLFYQVITMPPLRTELSSAERAMPVEHYIDPGFVNFRLVETVVGAVGTGEINRLIATIPSGTPDWQMRMRLNHVYTRVALAYCSHVPAPSLRETLANKKGTLVCSTEHFGPCPQIYDASRVQIPILLDESYDLKPEVHLSTEHIRSDTTRSQLFEGDIESFIAVVHGFAGDRLILHPLVIGSPWLTNLNVGAGQQSCWCWSPLRCS